MTQPAPELRFVKGNAVLGNARSLCEQVLKRFRTSTRMQTWNITQQAYATSVNCEVCDDVTRTAIEEAIAADVFDCRVGGSEMAAGTPERRRFTIPPVQAVAGEPTVVGSLTEFIKFFERVFSRVEAVDEARNQVERTLGQTQDQQLHWHTFCRYVYTLTCGSKGLRLTQHWIDFPGRVMQGATKAQQRQLMIIGAAHYAEQPLTVQSARSLLAPMIDSAVAKSEALQDVTAGPPAPQRYQQQQSKGKEGWQRRSGYGNGGGYSNYSAPTPAPAPAPYGQAWAKKQIAR